jgi:hypothetical protein
MVWTVVPGLAVLTILYGILILGLIWLQRRVGIPARWAIVVGFLGFGIGTSLVSAWVWPFDSSVYPNVWAILVGDRLYAWSADYLGDPWLLRVPRVYVVAATVLYGGLGLLCQWFYGRRRPDAGLLGGG